MPMARNPMITDAGPPLTKEPPDPMKRPEPMAPPLCSCQPCLVTVGRGERQDVHGDHLHVSALEVAVKFILFANDDLMSTIIVAGRVAVCGLVEAIDVVWSTGVLSFFHFRSLVWCSNRDCELSRD